MIFSMVAVCCFDAQASQVDKDFINRSKDKNAYAFQQFNKILSNPHRSEVERKCLFDARMAQLALTYTRRFQWLAGFMVHNNNLDRRYRIKELSNPQLEQIAQDDLAALQATQLKASEYKLQPIDDMLDQWKYFREKSIFVCGDEFLPDYPFCSGDWVENSINKIYKKYGYFSFKKLTGILKMRNDALNKHVKAPYKASSQLILAQSFKNNNDKLVCHQPAQKYLDQPIMSEFKYVAKLQKENGVDKNPATNKFAKLFDRIA
ncbi:hypothetical protein C0J27_04645 [Candidatus Chromulinivorax destructor]|uniref:Uncharacterized protein n=2 Tax=Candidatus Chromulinivorax destructor TaxID=2066483 RepID=A0A345ZCH6_9BACT|nr:hypothetical protein C0J27_04645 [Candidatus Chromulinivorax destructor]